MERVNKLINTNAEDALFIHKWTTFNDDKKPSVFQPFAHSSDRYMFVYRRVDVPEVAFPPTIPPENLKLVSTFLKAHPGTVRGKLATSFRYNTVGADPTCPVTRLEVNALRDDVMKIGQGVSTLRDEMRTFRGEVENALEKILKCLSDQQKI